MTVQPPNWAISVPSTPGVHHEPASAAQWQNMSQAQINAMRNLLLESIWQILVQLLAGGLLPGAAGPQLTSWASNLPLIGPLLGALTGSSTTAGGGMAGLSAWGADLRALLGNPTAMGSGSPVLPALGSIPILGPLLGGGTTILASLIPNLNINQILTLPGQLSTMFSPFNPPQVIGTGQLTNVTQNLLVNPTFTDANSMLGELVWTWDAAKHSAAGGSAKVLANANANAKSLLSNPIQVVANDTINVSAWTQWNSLVYTGTPISLMLNIYDANNSLITAVTLQAATMTGATSSWVQLIGSHVITETGAAWVRLRFDVSTAATAGSVWFSDATLMKPNLVPQNAVAGLSTLATQPGAIIDTGVQAIVNNAALIGQSLAVFNAQVSNLRDFIGYVTSGAAPHGSVANIASNVDNTVKARAVQKPPSYNIDPTVDSTFYLSDIWQGTPPTMAMTQGATVMGDITIRDGGIKQAVTWYGYPTGGTMANILDFRVNLFTVNQTTNVRTRIHTSANIAGSVGTGSVPVFNNYTLPSSITCAPGDKLTAELEIFGTGTYNVVAQTISTQLTHPTISFHGSTRTNIAYDSGATGYFTNTQNAGSGGVGTPNTTVHANEMAIAVTTSTIPIGTNLKCTFGGVQMTLIDSVAINGSNNTLAVWGLLNPPVGAQSAYLYWAGTGTVPSWFATVNVATYPGATSWGTSFQTHVLNGNNGASLGSPGTNGLWVIGMAADGSTITQSGGGSPRLSAANVSGTFPSLLMDSQVAGTYVNTRTAGNSGIIAVPIFFGPPATYTPGAVLGVASSNVVPWIGLSGTVAPTQYTPVIIPFYSSGTFDPTNCQWANYIDIVVCGPGGNGMNGSGYWGGYAGTAGGWNVATLAKAVWGAVTTSVNVTGGGSQTASTISVPGWGTLSGPAGTNGTQVSGTSNLGAPAGGPGDENYNGTNYPGGAGGGPPQASGGQPGGGGAGGNAPFTVGSNIYGGAGGAGIGYIKVYQ